MADNKSNPAKPAAPAESTDQAVMVQPCCIKCFSTSAFVKLHLDDASTFECSECEETFSACDVEQVIDLMADWPNVLEWIKRYPTQ